MTSGAFKWWNASVLLCAALLFAFVLPRTSAFLHDDDRAHWMRASQPHLELRAQQDLPLVTFFRASIEPPRSSSPATIRCESRNTLRLIIDGHEVQLESDPQGGASTSIMGDGARHELFFRVDSRLSPPLLKVSAPEAGLFSDSTWQCSDDGREWRPVRLISDPAIADQALQVPSAWTVFSRCSPYLFLALIVASSCWLQVRRMPPHLLSLVPGYVRLLLVCALCGLAINNWPRLPANLGMDSSAHLEYIDFIAQKGRLPQVYEGWEGHQAPLYYMLCAGLRYVLSLCGSSANEHTYRLLSLLCLIIQVEVVYRIMRTLFPGDACGQCVGLILGSTVPMSIGLFQFVGNEPLAGLLGSVVLAQCLSWSREEAAAPRWPRLFLLGAVLGAACLTKVTCTLLVPVVFAVVIGACGNMTWPSRLVRAAVPLLVCACICGWWGARNLGAVGHIWVAPWDLASQHIVWWQEPGYRTVGDLTRFGYCLDRPLCAVTVGLWDGLYAGWCCDSGLSGTLFLPPWNYTLMLVLPILYLPIGLACVLGALAPVRTEGVRVRACMLGASMLYAAAIMFSYAAMPCYSSAKPTYALALTPIMSAFSVIGLRVLPRTTLLGALACGWCTLCGAITIAAYWA